MNAGAVLYEYIATQDRSTLRTVDRPLIPLSVGTAEAQALPHTVTLRHSASAISSREMAIDSSVWTTTKALVVSALLVTTLIASRFVSSQVRRDYTLWEK
jgi:hypothetical protein